MAARTVSLALTLSLALVTGGSAMDLQEEPSFFYRAKPARIDLATVPVPGDDGGEHDGGEIEEPPLPPLSLGTATLPDATVDEPWAFDFGPLLGNADAGEVTWSFGSGGSPGPDWFGFADAGVMAGTPLARGTYAFEIVTTDGDRQAQQDYELRVRGACAVEWSTYPLPGDNQWRDVAYGNGRFVTVSQNGTNRIAYSLDGQAWSAVTAPADNSWRAVHYADGRFLAGSRQQFSGMTSVDGVNWSLVTLPGTTQGLTYGHGRWVIAGAQGIFTSTDLVNWTQQDVPSITYRSLAFGDGKFVALGESSNVVATSDDGENWTSSTLPVSGNWYTVTHGNGKFIAAAFSSSTGVSSSDGVTWESFSFPVTGGWYGSAHGSDTFVFVANSNRHIAVSNDGGTSWLMRQAPANNAWNSIKYVEELGMFISAAASGTTHRIMSSYC